MHQPADPYSSNPIIAYFCQHQNINAIPMEYRQLGGSGLYVPVLSFGTATFGGSGDFFKAWGNTQVEEAKRMVNLCVDAGVNFFDTADIHSHGASEEILGQALTGLRDKVL